MKKLVCGCLSSLFVYQVSHAMQGAFYVGTNASRDLWRITQQMTMYGTKVVNTSLYNRDWGQKEQLFNAEILAGVKASNGTVFGALEAWYNPGAFQAISTSDDIVFNSSINHRWGARMLAGVQHREMTIYSILGLGKTQFTNTTSFPSSGVYGSLPGVSLASTNGSGNEVTQTVGIGMSVVFTKNWDVSVEYQHQSAESSTNLYDSLITYLGTIGKQTTKITANTLNLGLKYHFKPLTF